MIDEFFTVIVVYVPLRFLIDHFVLFSLFVVLNTLLARAI
jgi:hypothetical protein